MSIRSVFIGTVAFAAFGLASHAASAAPQVLGLIASNGQPTPLVCGDKDCRAHFSAFCLQQNRPAPAHGDAYSPAPGGDLTLVITKSNGAAERLPAAGVVKIESQIGFTSVEISLPRAELARLGAAEVALDVGSEVSLIPVARNNDPYPQTDDEVALATGPMRTAATKSFESPGRASDAARITTVFINALPSGSVESATMRDGLWVAMLSHPALAKATPEGLKAAGMIYEGCKISVESRSTYSMRNCLELRHADLLAETNHKFWKDNVGY